MELRQLYLFDVLAEHLHYGRAAVAGGIGQPALSQQILRLERELGITLLRRTSRSAELTHAGTIMLAAVRSVLSAEEALRSAALRLTRAQARRLVIGYSGAPQEDLSVHIQDVLTASGWTVTFRCLAFGEMAKALPKASVDVLLCRGALQVEDVVLDAVLVQEPRQLLLSRTHPLATQDEVTLNDLADEMFVRPPDELSESFAALWSLGQDVGLRPECPEDLLQIVAEGRALALSPASSSTSYARDDVVHRNVHGLPPAPLHLAWHTDADEPGLETGVLLARDAAWQWARERVTSCSQRRPGTDVGSAGKTANAGAVQP